MKRRIFPAITASLLLAGLTGQTHAATGDSVAVNITITVTAPTCEFDKLSDTVQLDTVRVEDFTKGDRIVGIKDVPVSITCNNLDAVKIKATGVPAYSSRSPAVTDTTLFHNTGTAKNIGLAFMDASNNPLSSADGNNSVVVTPTEGKTTYVFKAGYGAIQAGGGVSGGSFQSSVNLTFNYE